MNRTDRLLAIVLELQGKGWQRAEDLARTFETSKRTIYRDLQALGQAGVPIVAISGQGYALVEGYFLPPLSFTVDEATMLLLGSSVMAQSFDEQYRGAALDAGRKIAAVLPEATRQAVESLRQSIQFIPDWRRSHADEQATLQRLRRALVERRTVCFRYHARQHAPDDTPAPPERLADPISLVHVGGAWYLVAHDHFRCEVRRFRLDRMEEVRVTERQFQLPDKKTPLREPRERQALIAARILFAPEISRWVREAPSYFTVAEEDVADGLLVTLYIRREEDVVQWILGWGGAAHVLEPESLRRRMADELSRMSDHYRNLLP